MCVIADVEKHQKWMCEEVYRIAKKLAKTHNYEELSKEDKFACNLIKGDFSNHPHQTRWWVGAAKQSLERLFNEDNTNMKLVMIETPLMAKGERTVNMNLDYARRCMKDSLEKGEAPFAMHLLYTQVLDDTIPEEREQGMTCGLAWLLRAEAVILYCDYGVSSGMKAAYKKALTNNLAIELRFINDHDEELVQQVKCDLFDCFLEDATRRSKSVRGI